MLSYCRFWCECRFIGRTVLGLLCGDAVGLVSWHTVGVFKGSY